MSPTPFTKQPQATQSATRERLEASIQYENEPEKVETELPVNRGLG